MGNYLSGYLGGLYINRENSDWDLRNAGTESNQNRQQPVMSQRDESPDPGSGPSGSSKDSTQGQTPSQSGQPEMGSQVHGGESYSKGGTVTSSQHKFSDSQKAGSSKSKNKECELQQPVTCSSAGSLPINVPTTIGWGISASSHNIQGNCVDVEQGNCFRSSSFSDTGLMRSQNIHGNWLSGRDLHGHYSEVRSSFTTEDGRNTEHNQTSESNLASSYPETLKKQHKRCCLENESQHTTQPKFQRLINSDLLESQPECPTVLPKLHSPAVINFVEDDELSDKAEDIEKLACTRDRTCDNLSHDMGRKSSVDSSFSETPMDGFSDDNCYSHINRLPSHLLVHIFSFLPVTDLLHKMSATSKYWYNLARDPDLWRVVNLRGQMKLDDKVLQRVVSFSESVISVDISDARSVSDDGIEAMAKQCTGLTRLKLVRCVQLKEQAFLALGNHCPNLVNVYLDCCFALSNKCLQTIACGCPRIKVLHINQCSRVSDDGIIAIGQGCPELDTLSVDQCKQVGNKGLLAVIEGCPKLRKISAMSCIFDSATIVQLKRLSYLQSLELHDVHGVNDDCIMEVIRHCRDIETLNMALCGQITDRGVDYIARNAPKLKFLYLSSCDLTNQALISLGAHSRTIESVDVGWCKSITDEGAVAISETCATLRSLGLTRCDKVTIQTMDYLVEKFPHIHYSTFWLDCRRMMNMAAQMGYSLPVPSGAWPNGARDSPALSE